MYFMLHLYVWLAISCAQPPHVYPVATYVLQCITADMNIKSCSVAVKIRLQLLVVAVMSLLKHRNVTIYILAVAIYIPT